VYILHRCRRTGVARPLSSMPGRSNKRKPPRGLVVNHDDLAALAGQPNQAINTLQAIDTEIVSLKRQVRYNAYTYVNFNQHLTSIVHMYIG
jgi:hypothetical protein